MDDPLPQSPYKTLSVPKDATLATIRSAHRKLVLACHPDKVQDETAKKFKAEQFHQVQQAYEILSDESRRQRYDDKARLAELRSEMMDDRAPPRRSEYVPPRNGPPPVYEVRQGRVYEERVPGSSRVYPEEVFSQRPSARKFDEMFVDSTTSRRSSGRAADDRRRSREVQAERERERKARDSQKAREVAAREEKDRKRAKDRKKDVEEKSSRSNRFNTRVDDGSDSEMDDRYYSRRESTPPKRRHEELRRDKRDEPRRSSKREDLRRDRGYEDDVEEKIVNAQDYITSTNRSREAVREVVEIEPKARPSRKRADSNLERAMPAVSTRPVDTRRRSSDRERSDNQRSDKERSGGEKERRRGSRGSRQPSPIRKDSAKDRKHRSPEIVEASSSSRKASLGGFTSDPKGLKNLFGSSSKKEPRRSETYQPTPDFKHPGLRRAETMPLHQMRRSDPVPLKSSHLKNAKAPSDYTSSSDDDSSEDSDETPEIKPRTSSQKYKVNLDEAQSPRTVCVEPVEMYSPRLRDESPKTLPRRSTDRPSMTGRNSTTRGPPPRSMSYAHAEDRSSRPLGPPRGESMRAPPPLKTHSSSRNSPKLFGQIDDDDDTYSRTYPSPKMSPVDFKYVNKPRRSTEEADRDAYPGSLHKSPRRPSYQRAESVRV